MPESVLSGSLELLLNVEVRDQRGQSGGAKGV